jgi:hypothetical protein
MVKLRRKPPNAANGNALRLVGSWPPTSINLNRVLGVMRSERSHRSSPPEEALTHPHLTPMYAHLLCHRTLSEALEDASQHLVQYAFTSGVLQSDDWPGELDADAPETQTDTRQQLERRMRALLALSSNSENPALRRLVRLLESHLLTEFASELEHLWPGFAAAEESYAIN